MQDKMDELSEMDQTVANLTDKNEVGNSDTISISL